MAASPGQAAVAAAGKMAGGTRGRPDRLARGPDSEVCEQLRRLHLTSWYCLYAERLPECRQRAAELLASWRA